MFDIFLLNIVFNQYLFLTLKYYLQLNLSQIFVENDYLFHFL